LCGVFVKNILKIFILFQFPVKQGYYVYSRHFLQTVYSLLAKLFCFYFFVTLTLTL